MGAARPFSWKGRRLRTVLQRSIAYRRELERPWAPYRWRGHGWDWVLDEPPHGTWSFVELTSGEKLFREGSHMKHCVASYAGRCASGHSAIVSVRHKDDRRLTVEIEPCTRSVVQARGPFNRSADAEEQEVISLWARSVLRADMSNEADRAVPPGRD